ncbi:HD domain-containing protein [Streptomyces sp. CA-111067]|uniref:HD domain-containing protein n=1 Tax=Streptomyces sp. CA-111067 TaxID=3240046 RepID=UPI003D956419
MARFKALLIGASEYDDPAIADLPFVRDDLQKLHAVLTERNFTSVEIVESRRGITATVVHAQVSGFLRDAAPGDTLFVLLSGHGQHFRGADYLIPEDASFAVRPFADCCVEIGWQRELEDSAAARIVFLVDACREGIEEDVKSPAGVAGWSRRKIAAALQRKVAYVYACSPAQLARFVRPSDTLVANGEGADGGGTDGGGTDGVSPGEGGESFSLFSRAVADVVGGTGHAVDLAEFTDRVQDRMAALHAAYGKPGAVQLLHVTTDTERAGFDVLPGPARLSAVHPWVRTVTAHPAWDRTAAGPGRDALRAACGRMAVQLAARYEESAAALRDDPWHDGQLGRRVQERMGFLVGRIADVLPASGPGRPALSPTEAALAALLPLVDHTFWAAEAAGRVAVLRADGAGQRSLDQGRFQEFIRSHPRLVRRLRTLDQAGDPRGDAERIRWWLFHRWLLQQPELYAGQSLASLLSGDGGGVASDGDVGDQPAWVEGALSAQRLARFVRDQRIAPFSVAGGPAAASSPLSGMASGQAAYDEVYDVVAATTGDEHEVREPLVAALCKAAHALAIDPVDLPEIVVEHLGISDSVDLGQLLTTLRESDWRASGIGRALNAVCRHPAVQIALREHAQRTDTLLRDINRAAALAPLGALPPYADADRVRLSGHTPEHLSEGIRFQLAEDRVQELLMGESLYGDRSLAIRELYQNALDALRYRDARTQYLRRTGDRRQPDGWEGRITFRQGVDQDGRPYLECRDNGIGMGVHELSRTFAQGGARFVDLPEYVEEQALWAELHPKIELHPNSRFGIGVLSYFMLADEITVRTCRMTRAGRPGRVLEVTIAGPGNLFRIGDAGEGEETGTAVRLLLNRGEFVSCVDTLESLLFVSPYRVSAEYGSRRLEWAPGELSEYACTQMTGDRGPAGEPAISVVPSRDPDLWWAPSEGRVLADGLRVNPPDDGTDAPHGVLINLHGPQQPELTVNRRWLLSLDSDHVTRSALAAVSDLLRNGPSLVTPGWLNRVSASSLPLADTIAEQAARLRLPVQAGVQQTTFDTVGHFPADRLLLALFGLDTLSHQPTRRAAPLVRCMPQALLAWRLRALHRASTDGPPAGPGTRLSPAGAVPDAVRARPSDQRLLLFLPRSNRWLINAGRHIRPSTDEFPYDKVLTGNWPVSTDPFAAGANNLSLLPTWRPAAETLTAQEIFDAVEPSGMTAGEVRDRYTELGYRAEPLGGTETAGPADLPLLWPLGSGVTGWLPPGAALSPAQIAYSAAMADCSTHAAARRLRDLGYQVPAVYPVRDRWLLEERRMLNRPWSAQSVQPPEEEFAEVTRVKLVSAAHVSGWPVRKVAGLLREAGFVMPGGTDAVAELSPDDEVLLGGREFSPPVDRTLSVAYIFAVAARTRRPPDDVRLRFGQLGYAVPDSLPELDDRIRECLQLVTEADRDLCWYISDEPVPLHVLGLLAVRVGRSVRAVAEALAALGQPCAEVSEFATSLDPGDLADLGAPGRPVTAAELYAAAQQGGISREDVLHQLAALGYEIAPIDPEFERDVWAEGQLEGFLGEGSRGMPDFLASFSSFAGAPADADRASFGVTDISLPALAAFALRRGLALREASDIAEHCGLRSPVRDWFP